ncbi:glycosyltransferase family 9 protein [Pseudoalteromonas sp. T1lg65]|uniref:glycosyltransferase family 9 protein n=1 Tax=Pseudoalteromonas sp. T1lg65 TaxID=2077101 RepID=UPI003F799A63
MNTNPILVVLPKFLGDAINALPAIKMLKQLYPDEKIYLFATPAVAKLLEREQTEQLLILIAARSNNKLQQTYQRIKQIKPLGIKVAILLRGSLSEALVCKLANIPTRIGYPQNGRKPLLTHAPKLNKNHHYIHRYCRLVSLLAADRFSEYELPTLSSCKSALLSLPSSLPIIGVYFGGLNKEHRHYPLPLASETLNLLMSKTPCQLVLLGDKSEQQENNALKQSANVSTENLVDLTGRTSIPELIDVIASCDVLISIDSGPMHIAAAVNTPCVAVVGLGTSPWSLVAPKQSWVYPLTAAASTQLNDDKIIEAIAPQSIVETTFKAIGDNT